MEKNRKFGSWTDLKVGDLVEYKRSYSTKKTSLDLGPGLVIAIKSSAPDHHLQEAKQVKVYFSKVNSWAWIDFYKLRLLSEIGE